MCPESFAASHREEWSRWVLSHGLPTLPDRRLGLGEAVPVARWTGPDTAAVAHLRRWPADDALEPTTEVAVDLFHLVGPAWELWGVGGGPWRDDLVRTSLDVPAGHVYLDGTVGVRGAGGSCLAYWGEVGAGAATLEVVQAGRVTRHPIEAPVGLVVVSVDPAGSFEVRVLDPDGRLLGRRGRAS